MKVYSRRTEESRVILSEGEKDLLDKCADLIYSLMNEVGAMSEGEVTLFSNGVDNDEDCCDTYATKHEFYDNLEEVFATLTDLQMADAILVTSEDEY